MKTSTTMNWDQIRANGSVKKQKSGGPFVSRLKKERMIDLAESRADKMAAQIEERKAAKMAEKVIDVPIKQGKNGSFFFQTRKGGKFQPKMEISASLAAKLI